MVLAGQPPWQASSDSRLQTQEVYRGVYRELSYFPHDKEEVTPLSACFSWGFFVLPDHLSEQLSFLAAETLSVCSSLSLFSYSAS